MWFLGAWLVLIIWLIRPKENRQPFGQRYANNLDTLNAVQAKYEQENPNSRYSLGLFYPYSRPAILPREQHLHSLPALGSEFSLGPKVVAYLVGCLGLGNLAVTLATA